jgi:hypothetical protein
MLTTAMPAITTLFLVYCQVGAFERCLMGAVQLPASWHFMAGHWVHAYDCTELRGGLPGVPGGLGRAQATIVGKRAVTNKPESENSLLS